MYRHSILTFVAIFLSALPFSNGELKFLVENWKVVTPIPISIPPSKAVFSGVELIINCTTNNPNAVVNLQEKGFSDTYENVFAVDYKKGRITQVGQMFVLKPTLINDQKKYQCSAKTSNDSEIFLIKGDLRVNKISVADIPEIYPAVDKLPIEQDGKQKITCKTSGLKGTAPDSLFLEWYYETTSGREKVKDVAHSDEGPSHNNIDVASFTFTKFQKKDGGIYVCVRTVNAKTKTHTTERKITIILEDSFAPIVNFPDITNPTHIPLLSVKLGRLIQVDCSITGSPKPKRYWMKGSKRILNCTNPSEDSCIYVIQKASHPRDSGVYSCVGENLVGTVKKNITLEVQINPVLKKPTKVMYATYDEAVMLSCELEKGYPTPKIRWESQIDTCLQTKDCFPIEKDWKVVAKQDPGKDTPTMRSTTLSTKTQRNFFYQCIAENKAAKDTYLFKLYRSAKTESLFAFEVKMNPINEDSSLSMSCRIDSDKFRTAIITKVGQIGHMPTAEKLDGSNKIITYVKPVSDLSDNGAYMCEAEYKRGSTNNKTLNIVVKALVAPSIVDFNDNNVNQDTQKNLTIVCKVLGNPTPTITWERNGVSLVKTGKNTIDSVKKCTRMIAGVYFKAGRDDKLIICSLNFVKDAGLYKCTAQNQVKKVSASMELEILSSPQIVDWEPTRTFGWKDAAEVPCVSTANPTANVTWERIDGNDTKPMSKGLHVSILRFAKVTKTNAGLYRCTAENMYNSVSKDVELLVVGTGSITSSKSDKGTIIGIVVAFTLLLIIVIILVLLYRRHLKKMYALYLEPNENFTLDPDRSLFDQSSELPYDMAWEYPREKLTFIKTLGSGAFGQVWLAEAEGIHGFKPRDTSINGRKRRKSIQKSRRYHSMSFRYRKASQFPEVTLEKTMVAVKTLKEGAAEGEYKDLASELKILIHLGENKNIVNLLGACTTGGKICVILECCPHGSLLSFLREKRPFFSPVWAKHETDMEKEFTYIDLVMIAWQVGKGMDFLQSKKCVHRDLAARNVLVGDDYIMKIADFGLARDIYKDEFYLKETTGLLPVKWMAPESLFDKVYTASSDVWSFGILLWEIFTLGGSPYPGLPTEDLFSFLEDGKRMECPEKCPKDVFEIMYDCWTKSPYERPLFSQLVERLNNCMKQNVPSGDDYLEFEDGIDNYLEPEQSNGLQRGVSSEYLEATTQDVTHPKGHSHVPLLTEVIDNDDDMSDFTLTAPPPPVYGDNQHERYIPMNPGDHYKVPTSNRLSSSEVV